MKRMARVVIGGFILLSFLLSASVGWSAEYGPYVLTAPIATDGDTIRADVVIWPSLSVDAAIRVAGVDTPEMRTKAACDKRASVAERDGCLCEMVLAQKAKDFTDKWVLDQQPLTASQIRPDKYAGRYDAIITGRTGELLAGALIAAKVGRPYSGGARQPWCQ